MGWNAPLVKGFRSWIQALAYQMLIRLVNCFRNSAWASPVDLTCFEMPVEVAGPQLNAPRKLVQHACWASVFDSSPFWKRIC
eukprot:5839446-Alexandrium_andersonii.AAC.1